MVAENNDEVALGNDERWQRDPGYKHWKVKNVHRKDEMEQLGEK
jgi:chloramphenicol 3-O-phosphotransferase